MAVADLKLADATTTLNVVSGEPLGSPGIKVKLVDATLQPNLSFSFGSESELTLNPRGSVSVLAFNSDDDADPDRILVPLSAETPAGDLAPQLALRTDSAWLKYVTEADVKVSVGRPLASIDFNVDANAGAIFADYRRHIRNRPAREAFSLDLQAGPRFATVRAHVLALGEREALSLHWRGTFKARVVVPWSDIFTGSLQSLGSVFGANGTIGFKIAASATATFDVEVADDFLVVFSRIDDTSWRVGLRKAQSRALGGEFAAAINAEFADPNAVNTVVTTALEGLLGRPIAELKALLGRASSDQDQLSDAEKGIISSLAKRLGLSDPSATIDSLRGRLESLERSVPEKIAEIAKSKIEVGFGYEYNRITEHSNLLQAIVNQEQLSKHHSTLVRGHLGPLTASIAAKEQGVAVESYLNQKTLTRTNSWGFTLGIGKWVDIGGKDFKRIVTNERRNQGQHLQQSYLGTRGYKGEWIGEQLEWAVDLKADMKGFSLHPTPLVTEFNFGLHLVWIARQKKLTPKELEQWVDSGIVWGVLPQADVDHAKEQLKPMLHHACDMTVQIAVSNNVFRTMLPNLAASDPKAYASSLAAAMPWGDYSVGRSDVARRRELYSPLWAAYLNDPQIPVTALSHIAANHLDKQHQPDLAFLEKKFATVRPFTFTGLVELNGDTHAACNSFTRGAAILRSAIDSGAPNQRTIHKAFETMNDIWTQSHHVRAVGAYLLETASAKGVLGAIGRTLSVKSGDDVVVFTA